MIQVYRGPLYCCGKTYKFLTNFILLWKDSYLNQAGRKWSCLLVHDLAQCVRLLLRCRDGNGEVQEPRVDAAQRQVQLMRPAVIEACDRHLALADQF